MTDFESIVPQKPVPSRRKKGRIIMLAICAMLALTVFACCCAVAAMFVAVFVFPVFVDHGFAMFVTAAIAAVLAIGVWLIDAVSLLSTGQVISLIMLLLEMLRSPRCRCGRRRLWPSFMPHHSRSGHTSSGSEGSKLLSSNPFRFITMTWLSGITWPTC
jgi:hypothetical protein